MKSNPIKEMEKHTDIEPLGTRRQLKVLTQTEKVCKFPNHPLHCKLAAPSKNRLTRKSLNHLTKELRKKDDDILDKEIDSENYLTLKNLNSISHSHTIELEIPGLSSRQEQNPSLEKITTLELLEQKYPPEVWTQIYTDSSAQNAVKNGGSVSTTEHRMETHKQCQMPLGHDSQTSRLKYVLFKQLSSTSKHPNQKNQWC